LDDKSKSKLGVWISFFCHDPAEESLEYAWQMLEEAEKKLNSKVARQAS
jgi:hypothetical protein